MASVAKVARSFGALGASGHWELRGTGSWGHCELGALGAGGTRVARMARV